MATKEELLQAARRLVDIHKSLTETPKMLGALWLPPRAGEEGPLLVWLVEILNSETELPLEPATPFFFNPSKDFRFPLALIMGSREEIQEAIRQDEEWTRRLDHAVTLFGDVDLVPQTRTSPPVAA